MKRILSVLAAGLLAVASSHAYAADPAPAADAAVAVKAAPATEVSATVDAKAVATQQFTLKDGTTLTVDDKQGAWTTDAAGKNVAATDGDKVTADGKTLTVKGGKVVAGLDATTPASEAPAAGSAIQSDMPAGGMTGHGMEVTLAGSGAGEMPRGAMSSAARRLSTEGALTSGLSISGDWQLTLRLRDLKTGSAG